MEKVQFSNNLFIHPSFKKTINAIKKEKIALPNAPSNAVINFEHLSSSDEKKLSMIEKPGSYELSANRGYDLSKENVILGYDESFDKFQTLEGVGYLTAHSLILVSDEDYLATSCLTFNFYTRSKTLLSKDNSIKYANEDNDGNDSFEAAFKKDYLIDRSKFLLKNVPSNSILFIDGPLIGGQMTRGTVDLNFELLNKGIIPIFFVKNSNSNIATDNMNELKGTYNSDLHWAYTVLKLGQRTNFFKYHHSEDFSKIFCYLKPFDVSPQRIELHPSTYEIYKKEVLAITDLIYYLILVQGVLKNPQARPIAIAEKYAREVKKLYNINQILKYSQLEPTINQARGII